MKKTAFFRLPATMFLMLGLSLFSCATGKGLGSGVPKTLIITGIEGLSGEVVATISSTSTPADSLVAFGGAVIADGSVAIPLVDHKNVGRRWSGSGNFFLVLVFKDANNAVYYYSEGGMSLLKRNFRDATTTIPLSQFRQR